MEKTETLELLKELNREVEKIQSIINDLFDKLEQEQTND